MPSAAGRSSSASRSGPALNRRYFERIGQLRENMMVELRNREDQAKMGPITDADANKMLDASKETVSLIYQDKR